MAWVEMEPVSYLFLLFLNLHFQKFRKKELDFSFSKKQILYFFFSFFSNSFHIHKKNHFPIAFRLNFVKSTSFIEKYEPKNISNYLFFGFVMV